MLLAQICSIVCSFSLLFLEFWRYGWTLLICLSINNQQMHFTFEFLMRVIGMLLGVKFLKKKAILMIIFYYIS